MFAVCVALLMAVRVAVRAADRAVVRGVLWDVLWCGMVRHWALCDVMRVIDEKNLHCIVNHNS